MSKLYLGVNVMDLPQEYFQKNHYLFYERYGYTKISNFLDNLYFISSINYKNIFEILWKLNDIFYENFHDEIAYIAYGASTIHIRIANTTSDTIFKMIMINDEDVLLIV